MDSGEILRARRCPRCKRVFVICRHCDRGHVYCCSDCSRRARQLSVHLARRRHRQSPEGRLDHRDQERERRARKRNSAWRVGDHGSATQLRSGKVVAPRGTAFISSVAAIRGAEEKTDVLRCSFCGCPGRLLRFGEQRRKDKPRPRFGLRH